MKRADSAERKHSATMKDATDEYAGIASGALGAAVPSRTKDPTAILFLASK